MIAERVGGADLRRLAWRDLDGWGQLDLAPIAAAFAASAHAIDRDLAPLRPARPAMEPLRTVSGRLMAEQGHSLTDDPRLFFESGFEPHAIVAAGREDGFLTGYYEPEIEGTTTPHAGFEAPVLDWPGDATQPMADREAWEAFSLTPEAKPVLWLRDWTELFLVQVQGSARVRLPDGSRCRLVYAGRNGAPYTSIGRRLIETGRIAADAMSLDRLKGWLRAHGQEPGGEARTLMQENRSYIFFRREADPGHDIGPIGGQGLPLRSGVSIAVDRTLWCYGLPFWIATDAAVPGFGAAPLRRLFVAQDTGSAIVGPARVDLFLGSGEAAGDAAGRVRHPASVTVLLPRAAT